MNFRDTVLSLLATYHTDGKASRWDVMKHLFNTNGNGFSWFNGELVDDFIAFGVKYKGKSLTKKQLAELASSDFFHGKITPQLKAQFESMTPEESNYDTKGRLAIYSTEFDAINHIPKDIKPDWAAAIEEWKESIKDAVPFDLEEMRRAMKQRFLKNCAEKKANNPKNERTLYSVITDDEKRVLRDFRLKLEFAELDRLHEQYVADRLDVTRIGLK